MVYVRDNNNKGETRDWMLLSHAPYPTIKINTTSLSPACQPGFRFDRLTN